MRPRIPITVVGFILLLMVLAVFGVVLIIVREQPSVPTPVVNLDLNELTDNLANFSLSLLTFVATILGIILVAKIIGWLLRLMWAPSQLVVENFANYSGDSDIEDRLAGFTQNAREKLVEELESVRLEVRGSLAGSPDSLNYSEKVFIARETEEPVKDLVDSLSEVTPDKLKWVADLIKVAFPARGTKITGSLQHKGDAPDTPGMSFEVSSLESGQESTLFTVWSVASSAVTEQSEPAPLMEPYNRLLSPASRRLAYEISAREQATKMPTGDLWRVPRGVSSASRVEERRNASRAYQATLHNFYGVLYTSSAPKFDEHTELFYELAIKELKEAVRLVELLEKSYEQPDRIPLVEWTSQTLQKFYLPYDNLASVCSFLGRRRNNTELQNEALLQYQAALECVGRIPTEKQRLAVSRRILINQAAAKLLTGDPDLVEEAVIKINEVENGWDVSSEPNPAGPYSLACWYAVAATMSPVPVGEAESKTRFYLALALGRDKERDLWNWASTDEDLQGLDGGFLPALKAGLVRKLLSVPNLPNLPGGTFQRHIGEILSGI